MDVFTMIARERTAVADLLDSLSDDQWTTSSCCIGWSVEDVAAHLTVVWNYSALDYLKRSLGDRSTWMRPAAALSSINAATVTERKAIGRDALISDIRAHVDDRTTPAGFDGRAPLSDIVIHRRDIEIPLRMVDDAHPEHARAALVTATSRRFALFNARAGRRGLAFRATDIDWSSGSGPEVAGSARALAHAMWGRSDSLDALTGDGVARLRDAFG